MSLEIPRVVDYIPGELRTSFTTPLPNQSIEEQYIRYGVDIEQPAELAEDQLHPEVRHMLPVVNLAFQVGEILTHAGLIKVTIQQADASSMVDDADYLHEENIRYGSEYRKVVVSDRFGMHYRTASGESRTVPNYGIVVIDGSTSHRAQRPKPGTIRTRLIVTSWGKSLGSKLRQPG